MGVGSCRLGELYVAPNFLTTSGGQLGGCEVRKTGRCAPYSFFFDKTFFPKGMAARGFPQLGDWR